MSTFDINIEWLTVAKVSFISFKTAYDFNSYKDIGSWNRSETLTLDLPALKMFYLYILHEI
jgi:hypothetical protein